MMSWSFYQKMTYFVNCCCRKIWRKRSDWLASDPGGEFDPVKQVFSSAAWVQGFSSEPSEEWVISFVLLEMVDL